MVGTFLRWPSTTRRGRSPSWPRSLTPTADCVAGYVSSRGQAGGGSASYFKITGLAWQSGRLFKADQAVSIRCGFDVAACVGWYVISKGALTVGGFAIPYVRIGEDVLFAGGGIMNCRTIGLDLAKQVFQIHCVDEHGRVALRKQLPRQQLAAFFANLPSRLVAMEACGNAHFWAHVNVDRSLHQLFSSVHWFHRNATKRQIKLL